MGRTRATRGGADATAGNGRLDGAATHRAGEPSAVGATVVTTPPRPAAGGSGGAGNAVPRRALRPLAICLEAAVFGVLAMVAANRVDGGPDAWLLAMGWTGFAISAIASVVFAAWSGRLDGDDQPRAVAASGLRAGAAGRRTTVPEVDGAAKPAGRAERAR